MKKREESAKKEERPVVLKTANEATAEIAARPATTKAKMEDGGWQRPERCQGNVCQGNNPENAFSRSLDKHSDFGFFPYGGPGILSDMRDADGLQWKKGGETFAVALGAMAGGAGVSCGDGVGRTRRRRSGNIRASELAVVGIIYGQAVLQRRVLA